MAGALLSPLLIPVPIAIPLLILILIPLLIAVLILFLHHRVARLVTVALLLKLTLLLHLPGILIP